MCLYRFALLVALLLGASAHQAACQDMGISPEAILSIRQVDGDVRLSPDGRSVAVVIFEPVNPSGHAPVGESNIWIVPADETRALKRLAGSSGKDERPRWSPDGHSIAFLSARPWHGEASEGSQLFLASLETGAIRRLTGVPAGIEDFVWAPDGRSIAFIARNAISSLSAPHGREDDDAITTPSNAPPSGVYDVTIADGHISAVTHGNNDVKELTWSPDGKSLAMLVDPGPPGGSSAALTLEVIERSSGAVIRTLSDNAAPIGGTLRWSPDGEWISFLQNSPSKFASWLAVVPAGGGPVQGILQDDTGTVWRAEWLPTGHEVLVEEVRGLQVVLRAVDMRTQSVSEWGRLTTSQDNYGVSTDGRVAAYVSESARAPADVWIAARGKEPRRLTALNPQVAAWRLGDVHEIEWQSTQDGATVRGVLVTPPNYATGRPYPTIVETHPGDSPWWPGWSANWWAWGQLLATHGYVVCLPNYRGVTGQGWRAHEQLADWGGLSYHDLMDGVDEIVRRGIADSTRLGIGGWSNGGFNALWAVTHSQRFKVAVAKSAPTDFSTLYATSPVIRADMVIDFGGVAYDRRDVYDAHSPLTYVRACKTPTLLVYGEHDIVSASQGDEFYSALEAAHVPAALVVYPREGHGLDEYRHQVDFQQRLLMWFDRYLK